MNITVIVNEHGEGSPLNRIEIDELEVSDPHRREFLVSLNGQVLEETLALGGHNQHTSLEIATYALNIITEAIE